MTESARRAEGSSTLPIRLLAIGDRTWTDYEVTVPIVLNGAANGFGFGMLMRWDGHTDDPVVCGQPKCGYLPLGAILWQRDSGLEIFGNDGINYDTIFEINEEEPLWDARLQVIRFDQGVDYPEQDTEWIDSSLYWWSDGNMGCPHDEGEDFPVGEDCVRFGGQAGIWK